MINSDAAFQRGSSRRLLGTLGSYMSGDSSDDDQDDFGDDCGDGSPSNSNSNSSSNSNRTSFLGRREERNKMRASIITKLEAQQQHVDDQIENLKIELEFRRAASEAARVENKAKLDKMIACIDCLKWNHNKALHQDIQRRSSLGGYVSTMRGVTGPGSMYVQTIEGQACRSLHLYEVKKKQRDLMNRQAKEMVQHMKNSIHQQEDEKAELSKKVMTQSFEVGCEKREYARRCEAILKKQRILINELESKSWQQSFLGTDWMDAEDLSMSMHLTTSLPPTLSTTEEVASESSSRQRPRRRASIGYSPAANEQSRRELRRNLSSDNLNEEGVNELIQEVTSQPKNLNRPVRRSSLGGMVSNFNSSVSTITRRMSGSGGDVTTVKPAQDQPTDMHSSAASVAAEFVGMDESSEQSLKNDIWNPAIPAAAVVHQIAA